MRRLALALTLALPLAALPAAAQQDVAQAAPFPEENDAAAALQSALDTAAAAAWQDQADGAGPVRVLAIFGANWCHDSRDLVAMLDRPRLAALIARSFEVVLIDAGMPQTGNGRNLDLAARHGVGDITGTPTVLVLDAEGALLNTPDNARGWRNASSRSEGEVYRFLRQLAKRPD